MRCVFVFSVLYALQFELAAATTVANRSGGGNVYGGGVGVNCVHTNTHWTQRSLACGYTIEWIRIMQIGWEFTFV